jgi:hypothetical protein
VKHAGPAALDRLEPLLKQLAVLPDLKQRSRGVFYRKAKPFLHFHEDNDALFADLRSGADFDRHEVSTAAQQGRFLELVKRSSTTPS